MIECNRLTQAFGIGFRLRRVWPASEERPKHCQTRNCDLNKGLISEPVRQSGPDAHGAMSCVRVENEIRHTEIYAT